MLASISAPPRFTATPGGRLIRRAGWGWFLRCWALAGWVVVAGGLGLGGFGMAARAADAPAVVSLSTTNDLLTAESVSRQLTALSNRTDLAVGVRTNALALYLEAALRLAEARRQVEEATRLHVETTNAPVLIAEMQALLAAPATAGSGAVAVSTNEALTKIEQRLAQTDVELAQATKDQEGLAQEPSRRTARLAELTRLIAETRATRERLVQESRTAQAPEMDPELRQASRYLVQARWQYRDAELARYEAEQANLNATADVTRLRSDVARRRMAALTQEREGLVAALNLRRKQESIEASARAAEATRRAEAMNEPWLLELAQTNAVLARERSGLAERLRTRSERLELVTSNRLALRETFQSIRDRVDAAEHAGLSRNFAIGLLLRRQQLALRGKGNSQEQARQQLGAISDAQIAQFAAVDARRGLEPIEDVAAALVARWARGADPERARVLLQESRALLGARRETLAGLVRDYDAYLGLLLRFQAALEESAAFVDEFRAYLDQRVLWIRSSEALDWGVIRREAQGVLTGFRGARWARTVEAVRSEIRQSWMSGLAAVLGTTVLFGLRGRFHRRLTEAAAAARQGRNTSIRPTLRAVGYTALRAAPLPLFLGVFGGAVWEATVLDEGANRTLGPALMMLGTVLFVLTFLRETCLPDGLASAHFRMSEADVGLLNRSLTVAMWGLPAMGFLNRLLENDFAEGVSNRLVFIPTVLACAALAHVIFRPNGGVGTPLPALGARRPSVNLWRRLAHAAAVLMPLLFGLASAMGYNYSARHLWIRFLGSILTALGLKLLAAVLLRGIYLTRRRLAMEHALKHRPAAGEGSEVAAELAGTEDSKQVELLASMGQARRLLNWAYGLALAFSLLAIWSATLPALHALDQIPLWSRGGTGVAASGPAASALGTPGSAVGSVTAEPARGASGGSGLAAGSFVSVWDLMLVLLTAAVVVTAAANLPGFLEMAVFSHAKFERGTSYAVTTTLRYAMILIGVVITAQGLGLEWSQVQWLAAAVTLGIGFGLQEIFANFVSGLILLLERPVRIGDVVTVGDTTGSVTRIQIRATTIRDAENRELILPNKELITGRFVNWTLTDPVTRIVCSVGISYESDIQRAQLLLLDIGRGHSAVLPDPEPEVTFDSFGESTLNLSLRVHVGRTDERLPTLSDLNHKILEVFREAGIEIAYPKRDVNVRILPPDPPKAPV